LAFGLWPWVFGFMPKVDAGHFLKITSKTKRSETENQRPKTKDRTPTDH
jgi:hypothetical protein